MSRWVPLYYLVNFPGRAGARLASLYLKQAVPYYLPMYVPAQTAGPISTKFCTDLLTNSGKLLNTTMTPQPDPLTPGYPKLQNLSRSQEKKLCFTKNVQMGDFSSLNFSLAAPIV